MNRQQRRRAARANKQNDGSQQSQSDPRFDAGRRAHQAGQFAEAQAVYDQLLNENPRNADALHYRGLLAFQQGQTEEALTMLNEAVSLRPNAPIFHGNLANVLLNAGDNERAEKAFRKAIRLDRNYALAHSNLATLLLGGGRIDEAETSVRRALKLQPRNFESYSNLGSILRRRGDLDGAEAAFRKALSINPDYERAHSNLIFALDFNASVSFEMQQAERRRWAERFADPLSVGVPHFAIDRDPDRKLRIGYVSGDFRNHSAAFSFGPVILERDREAFEAYCYMTSARRDIVTENFETAADQWRPSWGKPDSQIADMIRHDKIDILVDLSGHSAGNKLLAFARRPAPIQVSAWGHCTGTGTRAMDYLLADATTIPQTDAVHCTEEVIELSCAICYAPTDAAPDVSPLPLSSNGYITFGCLNRIEKLSDETIRVWSRVLEAVPASRLLLKSGALDDKGVTRQLRSRLVEHGIEDERVTTRGRSSWFEHIETLREIDIALDPFPNNGGITTLETLWMGVPVVSLRGHTPASRIAASILTASGCEEWVQEDADGYFDCAITLASEPTRLAALRDSLRDQISSRPLANSKLYAREVEGHYRRMWHAWCSRNE
ncbi:MAG: acetylglucosamine transferase [Rhodospirillaceae bacterium]|nr:acetylglucosamine transferase [Rhodospirillaceae bacterium]|tara:strand:- start:365 stop:2188 length:1824 start_codon:yes stop_codon:yes gene_type:complete